MVYHVYSKDAPLNAKGRLGESCSKELLCGPMGSESSIESCLPTSHTLSPWLLAL